MKQEFRTAAILAVTGGTFALLLASPATGVAATKVWVTNGTTAAGATVTFTAVNTSEYRMYNLTSGAFFSCPTGTVTLTGSTVVGNPRPTSATAKITGVTFPGPSAATRCKFSGLDYAPITASSPPTSTTSPGPSSLPWSINVNQVSTNPPPTSPPAAPASGQRSDGTITAVRLQITIPAANCTIDLGNGNVSAPGSGTIAGDGPTAANRVSFVNGSPSSLSIRSTSTSPSLGINRLYQTSTLTTLTSCASGWQKTGDKWYVTGSSPTTPVTFSLTPSSGGPLRVEGYN